MNGISAVPDHCEFGEFRELDSARSKVHCLVYAHVHARVYTHMRRRGKQLTKLTKLTRYRKHRGQSKHLSGRELIA